MVKQEDKAHEKIIQESKNQYPHTLGVWLSSGAEWIIFFQLSQEESRKNLILLY